MPAANAVLYKFALLILMSLLVSGCKHIGLLFEPPATLKAIVQGEIKGMAIHCKKTLTLGKAAWEVMCKVSDKIDIKYRTQSINDKQTKLEILIDKNNGDHNKIIAAPVIFASKKHPTTLETVTDKARIEIRTEPIP